MSSRLDLLQQLLSTDSDQKSLRRFPQFYSHIFGGFSKGSFASFSILSVSMLPFCQSHSAVSTAPDSKTPLPRDRFRLEGYT